MKSIVSLILIGAIILIAGCATFSPPINGMYGKEKVRNLNAEKVDILFIFEHYEQTTGIDAVPKLTRPPRNFNDIFGNALSEISNIEKYNSITINADDINDIRKRENILRLKKESEYIIEMNFKKEKSFVKFFFGVIVSSFSATIIPIRYKNKYEVEVKVYDNKEQLIKTYMRDSELDKWVQTFMVFFYPFMHEKRKKEELYVECLHDIFSQIETEKILNYNNLEKVTRTIYSINEIAEIIKKQKPDDEINWNNGKLNEWVEKKDIAIIVHFPDDGLSRKMADQAFKMELENLDRKTKEDGILFWVNNEEKYPVLLISARNETVLKSQLENNNHLKILLNGMFNLPK